MWTAHPSSPGWPFLSWLRGNLLLPTASGIRPFTQMLCAPYVQALWGQGPGWRGPASLPVLVVFIGSKTSHASWLLCLLIPSRYQLHLDDAITRMSISYPFVPIWDLPPDTLFLPPPSSIYFNRPLPRTCCVRHPSANRELLRYLWWPLLVCQTNPTWLTAPWSSSRPLCLALGKPSPDVCWLAAAPDPISVSHSPAKLSTGCCWIYCTVRLAQRHCSCNSTRKTSLPPSKS